MASAQIHYPTPQCDESSVHQGGPPPGTNLIQPTEPEATGTETQATGTETPAVDDNYRISTDIDPNDNDRYIHQILDRWDVAALIINKMVGTGIFTGPALVLIYTQSKAEAMSLWVLGLVYTYLNMLLYLGYTRALPFIGGELIYLDAIYSKPMMLCYVLYGVSFVFLVSGTSNCLQFGAQVFRADLKLPDTDQRLVRLFAVCILTLVCFTIAYSNSLFRNTNKVFAVLKSVGMLVLFLKGAVVAAHQEHKSTRLAFNENKPQAVNHFVALSYVLFAYNGWENATFVRADVLVTGGKDELVQGFLIGGTVVGLGYIGINAIFLVAIGSAEGTMWDPHQKRLISTFQYAPWLFGDSDDARRIWAIATAISAVGSIAAVMYTSAKVKQSMAASNILPWSRLWIKQNRNNSPTPAGAVALHWISGVVTIIYTTAISDLTQAISFPGFLQIYTQKVFGIFITFGYLFLGRSRHPENRSQIQRDWNQNNKTLRACQLQDWAVWMMVIFLCVCNIGLVVFPCIPPYKNQYGDKPIVSGYTYPAVTAGLLSFAAIYYLLCFSNLGDSNWSLLCLVGLKSEIRRVCGGHRHQYFGYEYRLFITDPQASRGPNAAPPGPLMGGPPAQNLDPALHIERKTYSALLQRWVRFIFGWEISSHLESVDPYHGLNTIGCNCYQVQNATSTELLQQVLALVQPAEIRNQGQS